jgi:hypothetical protein
MQYIFFRRIYSSGSLSCASAQNFGKLLPVVDYQYWRITRTKFWVTVSQLYQFHSCLMLSWVLFDSVCTTGIISTWHLEILHKLCGDVQTGFMFSQLFSFSSKVLVRIIISNFQVQVGVSVFGWDHPVLRYLLKVNFMNYCQIVGLEVFVR